MEAAEDIGTEESDATPVSDSGYKSVFSYEAIDDVYLPVIFRSGKKYISVRMAEMRLLSNYPNVIPPEVIARRKCTSFYVTDSEAALLNEINTQYCGRQFGERPFGADDVIVDLASFLDFYDVIRDCVMPAVLNTASGGGWLQLNNTVCPYVWRDHVRHVPLSVVAVAAELPTDGGDDCVAAPSPRLHVTAAEVQLLNDLCAQAGRDFHFDSTDTELVSLVEIKLASNPVVMDLPPDLNPFECARCIDGMDASSVDAMKRQIRLEWERFYQKRASRSPSVCSASSPQDTGKEASSDALPDCNTSIPTGTVVYRAAAAATSGASPLGPSSFVAASHPYLAAEMATLHWPATCTTQVLGVRCSTGLAAASPAPAVSSLQHLPKEFIGRPSRKSPQVSRRQSRAVKCEVGLYSNEDTTNELVSRFPVLWPIVGSRRAAGLGCDDDVLRLIAWFVHIQPHVFDILRRQMQVVAGLQQADAALQRECLIIIGDLLRRIEFWTAREHVIARPTEDLLQYTLTRVLLEATAPDLVCFLMGSLFDAHTPFARENFALLRNMVTIALVAQGFQAPQHPPPIAYSIVEKCKGRMMAYVKAWSEVKGSGSSRSHSVASWRGTLARLYEAVYALHTVQGRRDSGIMPQHSPALSSQQSEQEAKAGVAPGRASTAPMLLSGGGPWPKLPSETPLSNQSLQEALDDDLYRCQPRTAADHLEMATWLRNSTSESGAIAERAASAYSSTAPALSSGVSPLILDTPVVELETMYGALVPCVRKGEERWLRVADVAEAFFSTCTVDEFVLVLEHVLNTPVQRATSDVERAFASHSAAECTKLQESDTAAASHRKVCRVMSVHALEEHMAQLRYCLSGGGCDADSSTGGEMQLDSRGPPAKRQRQDA